MAITINKISKSFGENNIFRDFSLHLPDTGCVCLFGPSGSGKTTLLNLIANLDCPDAGELSRPKGEISIVFQEGPPASLGQRAGEYQTCTGKQIRLFKRGA